MVCDRIVRLVLGDVGFGILKETVGEGRWREEEVREGVRSIDMRE